MKKPTSKILSALLTFIIGLGSATSWLPFGNPQTQSYCEVARNPKRYHGKIIRVRAMLSFGSGGMYVAEDCDPVLALASLVEFEGSEHTAPRAHNYVDEMLTDQAEVEIKKIDTIIVGRFNGEFSRGCRLPAYRIAATSIEKASP